MLPLLWLLPALGSLPPSVSPEPVVTSVATLVSTVPLAGAKPAVNFTGMRMEAVPPDGMEVMAQAMLLPFTGATQLGAAGVKLPAVTVKVGAPATTMPVGKVSLKLVSSAACGPLLRVCTSQSKVWLVAAVASGVEVPVTTACLLTTCTSAFKRKKVFSLTLLLPGRS